MGPLAIAGIGAGASLAEALLGGGQQGIPQEVIDMLLREYRTARETGFLPDEAAYEAQIQADIEDVMSQLPIGEEAFMAQIASQGIYGAGELTKNLYRDVYAPLARAGTGAAVRGRLGYAQAYQQGQFQATNILSTILQAYINKQPSMLQRLGGWLGEAGGLGMKYGLAKELGIFD